MAARRFPDDDLDITPQPIQAFDHLGFANPAELPSQQAGELGLRHAEYLCCLHLRQVSMANDVGDLSSQTRLHVHFFGIAFLQVGIYIAATLFNLDHL